MKEIIYKILDFLSFYRGWTTTINGMEIRLPLRYYRYYTDDYEFDNFQFYRTQIKPDSIIIDIGGHIGLNAVFFSKLAYQGHVYVFEPAPNTMQVLKNTAKLNSLTNITFVPMMVTNKKGAEAFYINNSSIADNANSAIKHRTDKNLKLIEVFSTTIDLFIEDQKIHHVDFVKIDAEGAEELVLRGATKLLARDKPRMTLGLHPAPIVLNGDSLESIYNILTENNYNILWNGTTMTKTEFCSKEDLFDVQLI